MYNYKLKKVEGSKMKDAYYLAERVAKWIIKRNQIKKLNCSTEDIKEIAKHVFNEEYISRRTVEQVKSILTKEGSVHLTDSKVHITKGKNVVAVGDNLSSEDPEDVKAIRVYYGVTSDRAKELLSWDNGDKKLEEARDWIRVRKVDVEREYKLLVEEIEAKEKRRARDSNTSIYSFKKGIREKAFKQYLRDRGIKFEPSEDGDRIVFVVFDADEAVDRRANEIVRTLKDSTGSLAKMRKGQRVRYYSPEYHNPEEGIIIDKKRKKNQWGELYYDLTVELDVGDVLHVYSNESGRSLVTIDDSLNDSIIDFSNLRAGDIIHKLDTDQRYKIIKAEDRIGIIDNRRTKYKYYTTEDLDSKEKEYFYDIFMNKNNLVVNDSFAMLGVGGKMTDSDMTNVYIPFEECENSEQLKSLCRANDVELTKLSGEFRLSGEKDDVEYVLDTLGFDYEDESSSYFTDSEDIPSIIEKQVRSLGRGRNNKDYDKVVESIKEVKSRPGEYDLYASWGLTLGERNALIDKLKNCGLRVAFYGGVIKVTSEKNISKDKVFNVNLKGEDPLSKENLDLLFKKFDGDEDKVIDYLRTQDLDVTNGDLQSIVEAYSLSLGDSGLFPRYRRINRSDKTRRTIDSIETDDYQNLLKLLSDSFAEKSQQPFNYDGMSEYQDFLTLYDVVEGKEELPEKSLVVLTYLFNELEEDKKGWEARLEEDKKKLWGYELKVFNSPEKEDAKYLVVGIPEAEDKPKDVKIGDASIRYTPKRYGRWWWAVLDNETNLFVRRKDNPKKLLLFKTIGESKAWCNDNNSKKIGDMKLTRKQKIWYAEQLEKSVDPKFLRRNYRVKKIKGRRKK